MAKSEIIRNFDLHTNKCVPWLYTEKLIFSCMISKLPNPWRITFCSNTVICCVFAQKKSEKTH